VWSFYIDFFLSGVCRHNMVADSESSAGLEDEGQFGYKCTLSLLRNWNISWLSLILFQVYFILVLPLGQPNIFLPKFKARSIPERLNLIHPSQVQTQ
jgi:hypothetical protein